MTTFIALDFETADRYRDSACAVGVVRVEGNRITHRAHHLIQPPRRTFEFTGVHGISWAHVAREGRFAEVWRRVAPLLEGAEFIAAHNASFDRSVLKACCEAAGIAPPPHRFECTVKLARER
ncbi:MAG: exonuclease domain-containing protein, partial [Byssovorax sp.]